MIKHKILPAFLLILILVMFAPASHGLTRIIRLNEEILHAYAPSFACQYFTLPTNALSYVNDAASAEEAISYMLTSLSQSGCQCDDALNLATLFIENAIRKGTTLDVPANGVFYSDLLQISAGMAQNINENALTILSDEEVVLIRQPGIYINFTSDERGALDISFPDDISGINFDNITIESEFADITIYHGFVSGGAFRIERGIPVASGSYAYATMPATARESNNEYRFRSILDYWAVIVVVIIMIVWGVLASMGKKLRLWVVPALTVIAIAANVWTHGLNQQEPDSVIYAPAPIYFYSVSVTMPPDMSAILSIPLGGTNPEILALFNEQDEPQLSWHNPATNTVDTRIYTGSIYSLRTYIGYE